jgi:rod shape-determining protein MreC
MGNKQLKGNLPLFFFFLFLAVFLFLVDQQGRLLPVRGLVQRPIIALEEPLYQLSQSARQLINQFANLKKRDQTLVGLEGELRQLALDQNQLSVCLEENEHLKKLLGAPLPPQWQFIEAKVVGQSGEMRLNQGSQAGIQKGMMVVSESILVGRVVSLGVNDCLVQLPSDPNGKIPAVVKKPNSSGVQARGLLLGQFGGGLLLDRVLQEEDIQKGDLVVTSGEEGWLPDLVIGQIEEVLPPTAAVYQKARVMPLVDYRSLRIVFVVKQ